jgi:hypothetical protein
VEEDSSLPFSNDFLILLLIDMNLSVLEKLTVS